MATVSVNIISRADNSGFASASRSLAKFASLGAVAAVGAAGAAQAVGALAVAGASLGALALPALGALAAGIDGIKEAASTATPQMTAFRAAMSAEFASGMTAGFRDLGSVLDAITPQMRGVASAVSGVFTGLAATVKANTGGLQQLADKGAEFVTRLGPGLNTLVSKMIEFGASVNVDAIFNGFSQLWALLQPLITLVSELAAAAGPLGGGFAIFGQIITAITPALVQIVAALGPALTSAMTSLTPAIGALAGAFATVVTAASPLLPVVAALVAGLVDALGPALPVIVAAMLTFGIAIKAAAVASAAYAAVSRTITVATQVWAGVQWLLNAAMAANPLVWVVVAIVALIAVIVLIATKTTWFQTIWQAMCTAAVAAWEWIKSAVSAFAGWIVGIWQTIVAGATAAWNLVSSVASAVWSGIQAYISAVVAVISAVVSAVMAAVSGYFELVGAVASAVWSGIQTVVSAVAGFIGSAISGAIDIVVGAFNTAKSIGEAAFNGIRSIIDTVSGAIQTVIGWVQSLISAIANINWPSPPSWLSSIFSFSPVAAGPSAFMSPRWAVQDTGRVNLARGYPSLQDLGGGAGRQTIVQNIDNRTIINVDGTGITDPQTVARSIADAVGRNRQTRGLVPAMRLGQ